MKITKLLFAGVISVVMAIALTTSVSAAQNPHDTEDCYITGLPQYTKHGDSFTISGNKASSTFEVKGSASCKKVITIASWQAPNGTDGLPYESQKLFKYNTGTFGVGRHTMTVELPKCYFQADIVRFANPTADDGGPVYENQRLLDFKHGGEKPCTDKPKPQPKPEPTPQPEQHAAAQPQPTVLPATGPAAVLPIALSVGGLGGLVHNIRSRRIRK